MIHRCLEIVLAGRVQFLERLDPFAGNGAMAGLSRCPRPGWAANVTRVRLAAICTRAKLAHPKNQIPKFNIAFRPQIREFSKHDVIGARQMCLPPMDRGRHLLRRFLANTIRHCHMSTKYKSARAANVLHPPRGPSTFRLLASHAFFSPKRGHTALARADYICPRKTARAKNVFPSAWVELTPSCSAAAHVKYDVTRGTTLVLMSEVSIEIPSWGLPALLLFAQGAMAILTIELFRTRVFPVVHRIDGPELVLDVWTPIVLVLPMMFFAGRVDHDVRIHGWMVVGGPVVCAIFAAGAALAVGMIATSDQARQFRNWNLLGYAAAGTSLILLMLAAAHDLTLWVGQCAFAAGAVLLWINTPELKRSEPADGPARRLQVREERIAGAAMTIALGCAAAQGWLALHLPIEFAKIGASVVIAECAIVLMLAARIAGTAAVLRIGGWAAVYGVLLGLGVFALIEMAPQAWNILQRGYVERISRVANGFGEFALEACVLAVFAGFVALSARRNSSPSRVAGVIVIVVGAMLAAYRIARMSM
jgi:hypothetical protein